MPDGLLGRIAAGDAAAVDDTVSRYGGLVYSLCRRSLSGAAEVEDAALEIFEDVWKSSGRFDSSLSSEAIFVATIARRRLVDRARRRPLDPASLDLPADVIAAAERSAARAELADEAAIAVEALSRLREEERQVLVMAVVHGLRLEGIAEVTRMPLGTVKHHARRGLVRLREIIDERRPISARSGPARAAERG